MKYKGIELVPITKPQVFNPPKEMLVWDDSFTEPDVKHVCAITGSHYFQVVTTESCYGYCADFPQTEKQNFHTITKGEAYDMLRKAGIPVKMDKDKNVCFVSGSCVITDDDAYLTLGRNIHNEIRSLYYSSIPTRDLTLEHLNKFITRYKTLEKEILK